LFGKNTRCESRVSTDFNRQAHVKVESEGHPLLFRTPGFGGESHQSFSELYQLVTGEK
jgi:hypothetical protein